MENSLFISLNFEKQNQHVYFYKI